MAITTLDGAIAGMQPTRFFHKATTPALIAGKMQSLWGLNGIPGPGGWDTTLPGVTLTGPQNGQLPFVDPVSGNTYLTRFVGSSFGQGGKLLLCDRLWHNGGFTAVATAQSVGSPTWPSRDQLGGTAGVGVFLGMEYDATGAANAPTITVSYTNSAGASGKTGTNIYPTANGPSAGSFFPIGLAAGDLGVQSVQSVTFSLAPTAGTPNLVAYRVLASLELPATAVGNALDFVTGGMAQFFNGSVPFLIFIPSTTTASVISGSLTVTQG